MPGWLNFIAFQGLWFALVLGAASGHDGWAILLALGWIGLHFRFARNAADDLPLLFTMLGVSLLLDSLLAASGLIIYAGNWQLPGFAPGWLLAMWALFALTLRHSMRWLWPRAWLAALVGAISGPAGYLAGAGLGAATLAEPIWQPLSVLALTWSLLLWTLAKRLNAS